MKYTIQEIFSADGILKHLKNDYIPRPSQIEAADIIKSALAEKSHVVLEGPCGFGKTYAYLIPAFLHLYENQISSMISEQTERERAIIVTDGISLQEQLLFKDLPVVQKIFKQLYSRELVCTLLKGRQNCVCTRKLVDVTRNRSMTEEQKKVNSWEAKTQHGDFSELSFVPSYETICSVACTEEGECLARRCPLYDECYYQEHKKMAARSDIVVTNYHMLFSDLKISEVSTTSLLPNYNILIFDEAHKAADIFRNFMEIRFGVSSIRYLRKKLREIRNTSLFANSLFASSFSFDKIFGSDDSFFEDKTATYPYEQILEDLIAEVSQFFATLGQTLFDSSKFSQISLIRAETVVPETASKILTSLSVLSGELMVVSERLFRFIEETPGDDRDDLYLLKNALSAVEQKVNEHSQLFISLRDNRVSDYNVMWFDKAEDKHGESMADRVSLKQKPVRIDEKMYNSFFGRENMSCILTSATLSTTGNFDYLKSELGISMCGHGGKTVTEYIGHSPFDLSEQEKWYLPENAVNGDLDKGRDNPFKQAIVPIVQDLAEVCGGGILCLTTAWSNTKVCYDAISEVVQRKNLDIRVFKQGDMPKQKLIEAFQKDRDSILVATKSFFTGVDIPGDSLRCVIVDKLPFPGLSDPVVMKRMDERGGFFKYYLPAMIIDFKQAVGRGVRTINDRCVVAILDNRLATQKAYKDHVTNSFTYSMSATRSLEDVRKFLYP